tara:strand:- start:1829 stop:2518 length:690 start_codon:yes stop_codon:yes gene_type:complete
VNKYEAIILSGGKGTRIKQYTKKIPKCLIKFNRKPFLYYQLRYLKNNGIDKVIISTGYYAEQIKSYLENKNFIDIKIINDGLKPLGTGGAVLKSLDYLKDKFFIIYGDSYFNFDIKKLKKQEGLATMAVFENKNYYDKSNVIFRKKNKIIYSKKKLNTNFNFIDYGATYLNKKVFDNIKNKKFDLSELYEKISKKNMLNGYIVKKRFYEIGSYSGIKDFKQYIKNEFHK